YRIHGSPGGSDVVPVEDNNGMAVPEEFALLQNYPNPFNSTTMIPFTVSKKSFVSLTIFNMMGQKLATLVHKEFLPGRYLIEWDGEKWSTGVYLLQMKAGNFNRVIKLLLIK
ncbi:MAG: T9SS type A sorting domain-containing protein, partial [candidate division KSB1 bacterium]|nr:T9SS type A sorting domain-containing protein [candidate division KSB1 bacterium]